MVSSNQPVMNSSVVVSTVPATNTSGISTQGGKTVNGCSRLVINSPPTPYTGQKGPLRNPRLVHFLNRNEQKMLSHSQPKKLYMVNRKQSCSRGCIVEILSYTTGLSEKANLVISRFFCFQCKPMIWFLSMNCGKITPFVFVRNGKIDIKRHCIQHR